MLAQAVEHGFRGIDSERPVATVGDGIDHHRQGGDVVEVGMSQEDVVDGGQFGNRQFADAGTGINQDVVVDEKRGGSLVPAADATAAAEYAKLHACLPIIWAAS